MSSLWVVSSVAAQLTYLHLDNNYLNNNYVRSTLHSYCDAAHLLLQKQAVGLLHDHAGQLPGVGLHLHGDGVAALGRYLQLL